MMDHGQNGAILLETLLKNDIVMNIIKKNLILYNRQFIIQQCTQISKRTTNYNFISSPAKS
jgi:hypothetical protein